MLAEHGEETSAAVGDVLFEVGDATYPFIAIREGEASIRDAAGREIVRHGASGFLGEMNLLSGQTVFLTAVVTEPMRYVEVDRETLRGLLFEDGSLSDMLLSAFVQRRERLQREQGVGIEIVGPTQDHATRGPGRVRATPAPPLLLARPRRRTPRRRRWLADLAPEEIPLVRLPGGVDLRAAEQRRALAGARHRPRAGAARRGRPADRRRRPGRARRGGLRRLGGPRHAGGREQRARRPGGDLAADRELPRLPGRDQRHRTDQPRDRPGAQVHRPHRDPLPGALARAGRARATTSSSSRTATRSRPRRSCSRPAPNTANCRSTTSTSTRA